MLTPSELEALGNLSRKRAGVAVGWIAIAEARALTELGFAIRTRNGWQITAAGEAALDLQSPSVEPQDNVVTVQFHPD